MSSIAANRFLVGLIAVLTSLVAIAKELPAPKLLQEPVLGLRYDSTNVRFDRLPGEVETLCRAVSSNENVIGHSWVYAKAQDAARMYYVIGGYFEDLHPEPGYPRYQRDELGVVVYVQGTECKSIDSARAVFDSRDFQEISQPVLRQLADDLAAHLVRAFGGKNQLRGELRNQHVDQEQLPQELREAFGPYFGK